MLSVFQMKQVYAQGSTTNLNKLVLIVIVLGLALCVTTALLLVLSLIYLCTIARADPNFAKNAFTLHHAAMMLGSTVREQFLYYIAIC